MLFALRTFCATESTKELGTREKSLQAPFARAAKRTDINDNKKNTRQQYKKQALLTWLVYRALISKCKFTAIAFYCCPLSQGGRDSSLSGGG